MLLMFTLNRPDVLPVDDFGIREGFRLLYGKRLQPKPRWLAAYRRALGAVPDDGQLVPVALRRVHTRARARQPLRQSFVKRGRRG